MKSPEDKQPTLTLVKANKSGQLKRLKPVHLKVIHFHLQGAGLGEISEKTGLSTWWICRILKSGPAKEMIAEYTKQLDFEFRALYGKAIQAVRDGLEHPDINIRLKAADKWLKAHGKSIKDFTDRVTAEDVVRRIMEIRLVEEKQREV